MKKITLIILASAFLLSSCELTGPSVKVEPPKVKVDGVKVESNGGDSKGKFCPPGQAKKDNC